jgi:hypothetical protein
MSISVTPNNLCVFVCDQGIFTSSTSNYLPEIPPPINLDAECPALDLCQKPRWADPQYYSLAFTPLSPRYKKQFDILKLPRNISVEEIRSAAGKVAYRTPQSLYEAFVQLETELLEVAFSLSWKIPWVSLDY